MFSAPKFQELGIWSIHSVTHLIFMILIFVGLESSENIDIFLVGCHWRGCHDTLAGFIVFLWFYIKESINSTQRN